MFFYHPDHLGSTGYLTDRNGSLTEHIQYFPFGETWVQQRQSDDDDGFSNPIAYQFTSKELDNETGLYYFGARYYDPRTSVWQSADPILGAYLDGAPFGGVFLSNTLNLYSYSIQNPIKYQDEDGEFVNFLVGAAIGVAIDAAVQGALIATGAQDEFSFSSLAVSAAAGATGVGITSVASKAANLGRAATAGAELTADVALSAAEQAVRGQDVSLQSAVTNALVGQAAGQAGNRIAGGVGAAKGAADLKYAPYVRARGVEDPKSHNFPYSFDKEILSTKPIPKKNGYNIYQKEGTMTGKVVTDPKTGVRTQQYKEGVFEIGISKDGVIDHRFFRPND